MDINKKNILFYFMKGDSDGGSDYSLFVHLIHLNLEKYKPIVVYRKNSPLIDKLNEKGYKVLQLPVKAKVVISANVNNIKVKKKKYFLKKYLRSLKIFLKAIPEALKLRKIILEQKIDLIHLNHNLNGDRAGIIAGILTRIKIISHYRGLYKPIPIDIFLSKFIDKIICISDFTKEEYLTSGINPSKCVTIYNGVDTDIFKPLLKQSNNIIIGCVGRLEHWKGQQVLIEAMPKILKDYPNAKVQFIGDGSNKENLIDLVKTLKIEHAIEFVGSVHNVKDYIKEFTIAIHSSIEPEPFGRVIIEAMAMGKVVVSTNIGGPKEIINTQVDGFLIEPNNSAKLTKIIIQLLEEKNLRKRIGKSASQKILDSFSSEKTTSKIEELYQ